jgi:anti-sigma B factor antagonist
LYELIIEIEKISSGVTVIRLRGPLTMKDLFAFQDSARSEAAGPILIDLAEVPYIDSTGLGALLGVMASCERNGRRFGITGACDRVRTLFEITHVDTLIPSFESVTTAAERFAGR